ncbi:type IV secretion protein Rhs [Acinetobacter nosocomialis]|uniref:type IV secretion protein Rhs n=1 Tax=Acinetobacter nosocomialis TaxID=106654 RepID=UPI0008065D96|nr:type IV secretion protein Rhs [Acinetobacter nosocomialis]
MAGGSQIIINKDGITLITPGKFEPKAGQHLFKGGEKANYSLPEMPNVQYPFSNKLDVYNLFPDTSNIKYSVLHSNGQVKTGFLDQYGRTSRIKSNEKEKVKVLIGGDEWHYYISRFGGTIEDNTYIKFLDFVGDPIPNLEFNLSNDNNKILMECRTNNDGEAVFVCPKDDFPILSVKSLITNEFKPILRIENNLVREIILVSPKILKEIDLLQETDEKGDYLRSNYHK